MVRDTLDILVGTGKAMLIFMSIYAVVMIAKPEELELRKGQLGQWWTQTVISRNDSTESRNSSPEDSEKPDATWGF